MHVVIIVHSRKFKFHKESKTLRVLEIRKCVTGSLCAINKDKKFADKPNIGNEPDQDMLCDGGVVVILGSFSEHCLEQRYLSAKVEDILSLARNDNIHTPEFGQNTCDIDLYTEDVSLIHSL